MKTAGEILAVHPVGFSLSRNGKDAQITVQIKSVISYQPTKVCFAMSVRCSLRFVYRCSEKSFPKTVSFENLVGLVCETIHLKNYRTTHKKLLSVMVFSVPDMNGIRCSRNHALACSVTHTFNNFYIFNNLAEKLHVTSFKNLGFRWRGTQKPPSALRTIRNPIYLKGRISVEGMLKNFCVPARWLGGAFLRPDSSTTKFITNRFGADKNLFDTLVVVLYNRLGKLCEFQIKIFYCFKYSIPIGKTNVPP